MSRELRISIEDDQQWTADGKVKQAAFIEKLKDAASELGESKPSVSTTVIVHDSAESEIVNHVVSGLSWPALVAASGYLLKHLSPILVEHMKGKAQREITIEVKGKKITVKGSGEFDRNLKKIISEVESMDAEKPSKGEASGT